ncbi:MAG: hypothetical protein ACXVA2_08915 [Mucilaginibacter sp.]
MVIPIVLPPLTLMESPLIVILFTPFKTIGADTLYFEVAVLASDFRFTLLTGMFVGVVWVAASFWHDEKIERVKSKAPRHVFFTIGRVSFFRFIFL